MSESLIRTAKEIQEIIEKGHPARMVFTNNVSFLAKGDEVGQTTRQISVYGLKGNTDGAHIEEVGYKAGGIHAPWLQPVILPGNAGEVRATKNLVTGLPRGAWHKVYNQVHDSLGQSITNENKRRWAQWRETGQDPDFAPDVSGEAVSRLVEKAWKPLDDEQVSVLENGLVALLHSLQEQPKDYVLKLIL
jgi:hypothetical protein